MFIPDITIEEGVHLPHWTKEGAKYHICFRLADSIPQSKLKEWQEERDVLQRKLEQGELSLQDRMKLQYFFSERIEECIDEGYGSCVLQDDRCAQIVADSLMHFHGERYALYAWCIMPNHVHVIAEPGAEHSLRKIASRWMQFTATKINQLLQRNGSLWQKEAFDHMIRSNEALEKSIEYVWRNPESAGFKNWKWRWKM